MSDANIGSDPSIDDHSERSLNGCVEGVGVDDSKTEEEVSSPRSLEEKVKVVEENLLMMEAKERVGEGGVDEEGFDEDEEEDEVEEVEEEEDDDEEDNKNEKDSAVLYCRTCSHQNPPEAQFCGGCGGALPSTTKSTDLENEKKNNNDNYDGKMPLESGSITPLTTDNLAVHTMMSGTFSTINDPPLINNNNTATVAPQDVHVESSGGGEDYDDDDDLETGNNNTNNKKTKCYATAHKKSNSFSPFFDGLTELFCIKCMKRHLVGKMVVLGESKEGEPVVIAGPYWPFCAFFTIPLIIVFTVLVFFYVCPKLPDFTGYILWVLFVLAIGGLAGVSCRNPGMVEETNQEEKEGDLEKADWVWNDRVKSFRPPSAIYSLEADVVVKKYDHFCPWTGTAIGENNYFCFKVFVFNVHLLCYFSIGLAVVMAIWFRNSS